MASSASCIWSFGYEEFENPSLALCFLLFFWSCSTRQTHWMLHGSTKHMAFPMLPPIAMTQSGIPSVDNIGAKVSISSTSHLAPGTVGTGITNMAFLFHVSSSVVRGLVCFGTNLWCLATLSSTLLRSLRSSFQTSQSGEKISPPLWYPYRTFLSLISRTCTQWTCSIQRTLSLSAAWTAHTKARAAPAGIPPASQTDSSRRTVGTSAHNSVGVTYTHPQ